MQASPDMTATVNFPCNSEPNPASGRPFSVISTQSDWSPEAISHTLSLVARLDADGYSQASIISMLVMEGAQ